MHISEITNYLYSIVENEEAKSTVLTMMRSSVSQVEELYKVTTIAREKLNR